MNRYYAPVWYTNRQQFFFNVYHTDLKQFNIIDNNYKFKTKLNNSKYNLVVLKKEKEVQIYIYYPVEKKKLW